MKVPAGVFERWIVFNGVGSLGFAVQLLLLALLIRGAGVPDLAAVAIAVEGALLHNLGWHQRLTWRSRRSGSATELLARAARFHLANGLVSMIGNLAVVHLLSGSLHMDPIAASIAAILLCSIVNFTLSELVVFRRAAAGALIVLLLPGMASAREREAPTALAAELKADTLKAWTTYEAAVDERHHAAPAPGTPFFALDAYGIGKWRTEAMRGGVAMAQMSRARPGAAAIGVPDGKIHHWTGAIFVPGTTVAAVLDRIAAEAGRESESYDDVIASKLIARDGDTHRVYMKLRRTKVITVTYNTEHLIVYRRLNAGRATARSVSTRIAELEDAGTPQEREKPVGADSGYLWRLNAYWRYEAVEGGVLVECESVSLSRSVPVLLRPFISGVVEGLARESLERTLKGLRTVLTSKHAG